MERNDIAEMKDQVTLISIVVETPRVRAPNKLSLAFCHDRP